ncbi:MAG: MarR family winged helix-turn-helix transcriptional regulator [Spirochaetota bacterium]
MSEASTSQQVLLSLRQIIRAMDLRSRQLEKSVGLTVPQLVVLKEVAEADGIPIGQIAKRISLSQATVTTIVDRLEQRGTIKRLRAETDRRKVNLYITPVGAELIEKSPTILQEEFLDAFDKLEPWEQTQMLATLQRVAAMMNAQELPVTPLLTVESFPDGPLEGSSAH